MYTKFWELAVLPLVDEWHMKWILNARTVIGSNILASNMRGVSLCKWCRETENLWSMSHRLTVGTDCSQPATGRVPRTSYPAVPNFQSDDLSCSTAKRTAARKLPACWSAVCV